MMTHPFLFSDAGDPFDSAELSRLRRIFEAMTSAEREDYRNSNAEHIANHASTRMLVVSGPGTGKSNLFKQKIVNWLRKDPTAEILALSFVRKLVTDLATDIASDAALTPAQKKQVEVHTLHRYARSIVERNHGTKRRPLRPYFKIVGPSWENLVWQDALLHANQPDDRKYNWKEFKVQLHDVVFKTSQEWRALTTSYLDLCSFYNATGFADLILRASRALSENSALNKHELFILDEYQDFNAAEERLIQALTQAGEGVLIVGDDDQVLYERLKSGKAQLIRDLYKNKAFANAMLPFCTRCSFAIVKVAEQFIQQNPESDHIEKIYLPLRNSPEVEKVRMVACATPQTAVAYIEAFVRQHETAIDERRTKLESGEQKDAFLLVLTPARDARFYGQAAHDLRELVAKYRGTDKKLSEDYFRLIAYYAAANHPDDNFALRKVLFYENVLAEAVRDLLKEAMRDKKDLCELGSAVVRGVLDKAAEVKNILVTSMTADEKVKQLSTLLGLADLEQLTEELQARPIGIEAVTTLEVEEEEDAEQEELEIKTMSAVELLSIAGSKGLSADHVIIIGFDNVNMSYVTRNAFYVAMTRARQSLHVVTAVRSGGASKPHDFLRDLPDAHLKFHSYKKGTGTLNTFADRAKFLAYLDKLSSFNKS